MADDGSGELEQEIQLPKLKVDELKQELSQRGLPTKGNKEELKQRLIEYLKDHPHELEDSDAEDDVNVDAHDAIEHEDNQLNEDELADEKDEDANGLDGIPEELGDTSVVETEAQIKFEEPEEKKTVMPLKEAIQKSTGNNIAYDLKTEDIKAPVSDTERKNSRLKRFGPQSADEKKRARAARFGTSSTAITSGGVALSGNDAEKIKRRAERFGAVSPLVTKLDENERIKRRRERFGAVVSSSNSSSSGENEAKKKRRAERFGL